MSNELKVVRCEKHDSVAVYFNGELVYQSDICSEALYKLAKHQGWKITTDTISEKEYEEKYS